MLVSPLLSIFIRRPEFRDEATRSGQGYSATVKKESSWGDGSRCWSPVLLSKKDAWDCHYLATGMSQHASNHQRDSQKGDCCECARSAAKNQPSRGAGDIQRNEQPHATQATAKPSDASRCNEVDQAVDAIRPNTSRSARTASCASARK